MNSIMMMDGSRVAVIRVGSSNLHNNSLFGLN